MSENNSEIQQVIKEIIKQANDREIDEGSKGIIFLDGGSEVFVSSYFYTMRGIWLKYKRAIRYEDQKLIDEVYTKYTMAGILTNGSSYLDLDTIIGMMEIDEDMSWLPDEG